MLAENQVPAVIAPQLAVSTRLPASTNPWHTVSVSLPGDGPQGQGQTIQVPALDASKGGTIDPSWDKHLPASLPRDVLEALERTGHIVQMHRELVPIRMNDGRQLVLPVEKVDIRYVGRPTY